MAHKNVLFHSAAREKILRGATQLADVVRVTLGPKSKSVLMQRRWGAPLVCNDGVTIAKEFELADAEENLGAQMLRQAAERTGEVVGDGTSTSTILAHAILADGIRNVVAGASAIDIRRGLERGARAVVAALRGLSRPVRTRLERAQVATISAHNDAAIGDLVAEGQRELVGLRLARDVLARERPVEDGDGPREHALDGLLGERLGVDELLGGHRGGAGDVDLSRGRRGARLAGRGRADRTEPGGRLDRN